MFKNLVFEGGGVRGFAYLGAVEALEERKLVDGFSQFAGSSIGALFALLMCLGVGSQEIGRLIETVEIESNFEKRCCLSRIYNLYFKKGLYSSTVLEKMLRRVLRPVINPDVTLKDLFLKTKKDLVIIAASLSTRCCIYFHYEKYPDVKLIDALVCSMCVPLLFRPKEIVLDGIAQMVVDGGLIDNYPLWVFNEKINFRNPFGERCMINRSTLGLKLLSETEQNNWRIHHGHKNINGLGAFVGSIVNTMSTQLERAAVSESYIEQTVAIPTGTIDFVDFNINVNDKRFLHKRGKKSMLDFLNSYVK